MWSFDRTCEDLALDENRLDALEDASKAARKARRRITESLRIVKSAEDELRKRFGSMGGSKLLVRLLLVQASVPLCLMADNRLALKHHQTSHPPQTHYVDRYFFLVTPNCYLPRDVPVSRSNTALQGISLIRLTHQWLPRLCQENLHLTLL